MKKLLYLALMMCLSLIVNPIYAQDEAIITYGETFIGAYAADVSSVTFGFEGAVGDVIYVNAFDNVVPIEFALFSPSGGQIAISDNAYIGNIELISDGVYTIEFTRPEWSTDEGEFIGHLGRYTQESLLTEDGGQTRFYEGRLDDAAAMQQFEFDMTEGDIVTVMLYGINVGMTITDPAGSDIIFEGVYTDPQIPLYRMPATGTYSLSLVTGEFGGTDFGFVLTTHEVLSISSNVPVAGAIGEDLPNVFSFETVAGKRWDLNAVLPENGNSRLGIYQFNGRPYWESFLVWDDGSGPNGQPRIRSFTPEEDGTYYIALWHDNWETDFETYEYELVVSPSTVLSIPNNSPITGEVNNDTGVVQYTYSGKVGERILLKIKQLPDSDGVIALNMYSSEDELIAFVGRSADRANFEITLPLDDTYEVVVRNASYDVTTTLRYEIVIEPITGE